VSKPKLLDIIREKSDTYCADILEKQRKEAEAVIEEAKKSAEEMRSRILLKVQSESGRLLERKHNSIRFRINARRYELKASAMESIWTEAESIVRGIERSDEYRGILEKLFFECLPDIPDGSEVRAAPDDAVIVRSCIDKSGRTLSFTEDADVHGGIEFHWPDGRIVLKNTLSHRLARLKTGGNAGLSSILFASVEDIQA